MEFHVLKSAVARQFEIMQKHPLFRVNIEKDVLREAYLNSFPAGTNEVYRERREHDCSCCNNFLRDIGSVVALIDGKLVSVWDVKTPEEPGYQVVADAMSVLVKSMPIDDIFLHYEKTAGVNKTFEQLVTGQKTWEHFFVNIKPEFVRANADIPSALAKVRDAKNVLFRALTEIDIENTETVLELINQNSLLRGTEKKWKIEAFLKLQKQFNKLTNEQDKIMFAWKTAMTPAQLELCFIRSDVIGTLLVNLSGTPGGNDHKGEIIEPKAPMELEDAVSLFEHFMNGGNYQRPTALVTKKQIAAAGKEIEELGLTSALSRRFANLSDITINNILYADRNAKPLLNGTVFDELASAVSNKVNAKTLDKIEEVSIENFLANILPTAKTIEALLENRHAPNLVSLIAPQDPTANMLFKWSNPFSLSYNGGVADAIKERVKKAGGTVEGDLCCRLAWDYTDDLDFHMHEPDGGHIYYGDRNSRNGGKLDVDANGGNGMMAEPVENIFYSDRKTMREGTYTLKVKNFNRRSGGNGFEIEIETFDGNKLHIGYDKPVPSGAIVDVAKIRYSKANGFEIESLLKGGVSSVSSKTMWNLPSQTFHKVNVLAMSPNFWDGQDGIGNKHYLFMLDGCKNDTSPRGFLNEFLKAELHAHRKVMEIVGGKMKVPDSDDQLSGLGFSSTVRNSLVVKVTGSFTRTIKIVF